MVGVFPHCLCLKLCNHLQLIQYQPRFQHWLMLTSIQSICCSSWACHPSMRQSMWAIQAYLYTLSVVSHVTHSQSCGQKLKISISYQVKLTRWPWGGTLPMYKCISMPNARWSTGIPLIPLSSPPRLRQLERWGWITIGGPAPLSTHSR